MKNIILLLLLLNSLNAHAIELDKKHIPRDLPLLGVYNLPYQVKIPTENSVLKSAVVDAVADWNTLLKSEFGFDFFTLTNDAGNIDFRIIAARGGAKALRLGSIEKVLLQAQIIISASFIEQKTITPGALKNIIVHEIGHIMGLEHPVATRGEEQCFDSIMTYAWDKEHLLRISPSDIAKLHKLYDAQFENAGIMTSKY